MKIVRNIITIDKDRCDGCGQCIDACHEGAIALIDGKARLVKEQYCDGLGACIGDCPQGAITMHQREAEPFDEEAVKQHLAALGRPIPPELAATVPCAGTCPGAAVRQVKPRSEADATAAQPAAIAASELSNWPVQLHLVPPQAPYLQGADLLISADCVPFALADFHGRLLAGRTVLIGCPKLDDVNAYVEKLSHVLAANDIASVQVAHMEVPCCSGLVQAVRMALANCGKDIPASAVRVGIAGEILQSETLQALQTQ